MGSARWIGVLNTVKWNLCLGRAYTCLHITPKL